uniref:Uncharacterized protein n=1 Tax=Glossina pallidipes TaxID=7398 RepID=A0A1B0ADE7_GLOPL
MAVGLFNAFEEAAALVIGREKLVSVPGGFFNGSDGGGGGGGNGGCRGAGLIGFNGFTGGFCNVCGFCCTAGLDGLCADVVVLLAMDGCKTLAGYVCAGIGFNSNSCRNI